MNFIKVGIFMNSFNLKQLESEYKSKKMDKPEYIQRMHDIHKVLFEYSSFIKNKDIKKIEIEDNRIVMTTRENGIKLLCDEFDHRIVPIEILNFDFYEKDEINLILKLIKKNDTILDIGANIGWYSLKIAKNINSVRILSFEPIPKTFKYLKENIYLNQISGIKTLNYGFSDEEKYITFYYYPEGSCNASTVNLSGRTDVDKITCRLITLDKFTKNEDIAVDFIKCDVEGSELFVFKGGIETIKRDKPIIFTELLRKWAAKFNYHPNDVLSLLKEKGYRCFTINCGNLNEIDRIDENTVETNFLFLNKEKHSDLIELYKK
jgi:FkbM family methyltransferase